MIDEKVKCWKCKNIATHYVETRIKIYEKPNHFNNNDEIDMKITSYQLCKTCAKKEGWKV